MTTDFRTLCAELLKAVDDCDDYTLTEGATVARARAALAEPVASPAWPSDEELLQVAAEAGGLASIPLDSPFGDEFMPDELIAFARAVLARYGHQPAPPAAGEVGELVRWLRGANWDGKRQTLATRAADLLERQAAPVLEPALARINDILNDSGRVCLADEREALDLARQALEQRHPAPVPVAERPWEREGWCDEQGRCWFGWHRPMHILNPAMWMLCSPDVRDIPFHQACLPATALPLPAGEVK